MSLPLPPPRLFLIRHGESLANTKTILQKLSTYIGNDTAFLFRDVEKRVTEHPSCCDPDLTKKGCAQAAQCGNTIFTKVLSPTCHSQNTPVEINVHIFSSVLVRAMQTAFLARKQIILAASQLQAPPTNLSIRCTNIMVSNHLKEKNNKISSQNVKEIGENIPLESLSAQKKLRFKCCASEFNNPPNSIMHNIILYRPLPSVNSSPDYTREERTKKGSNCYK